MTTPIPSPAIAIVGRHNSGKTTHIERLITELVARGYDVGSVKHHSHVGFDIDYPGKDSYRHRAAGASETVIAAPGQMARMKTIDGEIECNEILRSMPGHDIVVVEGYRKSGLPTIEIMREANESDSRVASVFVEGAEKGWPLGTDFTQMNRGIIPVEEAKRENLLLERSNQVGQQSPSNQSKQSKQDTRGERSTQEQSSFSAKMEKTFAQHAPDHVDISNKLPTSKTVAVITDIEEARQAAKLYGIEAFGLEDLQQLADFVEERYVRPRVSVVIQAGGKSRRMGRSKATVPFAGRPLICRLIDRLKPVADELIITTNEPDKLAFLGDEYPDIEIMLTQDLCDYRGALPGLYTALSKASNSYVAVVACDMVFASAALVVAEAETMTESGADVVVPVNKHGYEPFHAMYRKETCLPPIMRLLQEGEKRAQSIYNQVKVHEFPQSKVLEVEPMGGCFANANTPEELEMFERSFFDE